MVSVDNLHQDVLELVLVHLDAHDLCSAILVSRSFAAAAIPRLYCTLFFRREQAIKFTRTSPFATVLAHPEYSVYVHAIDIRSTPTYKSKPHPQFLKQYTEAAARVVEEPSRPASKLSPMCHDLNETVLEAVLMNTPQLVTLHVIRCSKIGPTTILRLSIYTPMLQSLAMTIFGPVSPTWQPTFLVNLAELRLDIPGTDARAGNLASVVSYFREWKPPLSSIHVRSGITIPHVSVSELLDGYALTLKTLVFHCPLEVASILVVCSRCRNLQELAIPIPVKEFPDFGNALKHLKYLHTLIDTRSLSDEPGLHITRERVMHLLSICRGLQNIVSGHRKWIGGAGRLRIKLQKYPSDYNHWLIPPQ
ncbi:hypothetical protein APHAL10511_007310 [Amanita phalloides]|nr:hypothetical protein APHAL10511_007310 [Amanita phalloides]